MNLYALGAALLIGVLALWRINAAENAQALAEQTVTHNAALLASEQARTAEQSEVIAAQREQMGRMTAADTAFRALSQTIARDGAATRQTLQELKENDQAVAEYLRGAVPVVYGVQFARPETTDPAEYNPGRAVPAGGLPPAGAPRDPGQ
jgi:uncharacterized protein YaaR (DUF327 family)